MDDDRIAIIQEQTEMGAGGAFSVFMLCIGAMVMALELLVDTSAIRQAAMGAVWTGWNVIFGLIVAMNRQRSYVVKRVRPKEVEN